MLCERKMTLPPVVYKTQNLSRLVRGFKDFVHRNVQQRHGHNREWVTLWVPRGAEHGWGHCTRYHKRSLYPCHCIMPGPDQGKWETKMSGTCIDSRSSKVVETLLDISDDTCQGFIGVTSCFNCLGNMPPNVGCGAIWPVAYQSRR